MMEIGVIVFGLVLLGFGLYTVYAIGGPLDKPKSEGA